MAQDDADTSGRATGLLASLQRLVGSFAEILHTRAEILSVEVEEAGLFVRQLVFHVLASVLFLGIGLLLVTLFIVKASPETSQIYVLGGFSIFYLVIGFIIALVVKHKLNTRPRLFSTTLAELEKDRTRLSDRS